MFKKLALCITAAAVAFTAVGLQAQEITDDVAFLRLGYQWNTIAFDGDTVDDSKLNGIAIEGEYNMNLGGMLLGFSLEYAYVSDKDAKENDYGFLSPMVSIKLLTPGGFYIGPGVSLRYLMETYLPKGADEPDSEFDLWLNGVAGYMAPIAEAVYVDVQARFGWNVTKNQFQVKDAEYDSNYTMAVYVGIGTRTRATGI